MRSVKLWVRNAENKTFSKAISGANECFGYAHERRVRSLDIAEGVLALTAAGTVPVN